MSGFNSRQRQGRPRYDNPWVSADMVPNLRFKVYRDGEDALVDGKPACVSLAEDAPRTFDPVPEEPVYVLLSNIQHPPGTQVRYTVRVEPATNGE